MVDCDECLHVHIRVKEKNAFWVELNEYVQLKIRLIIH